MANEKATAHHLLFYKKKTEQGTELLAVCTDTVAYYCLKKTLSEQGTDCLVIGQVFKNCTRMNNISV
jgi:hypothetical protein